MISEHFHVCKTGMWRRKLGKKKVKKKYLQADFNEGILQIVRRISRLHMSFPFNDSCLFNAVELFTWKNVVK